MGKIIFLRWWYVVICISAVISLVAPLIPRWILRMASFLRLVSVTLLNQPLLLLIVWLPLIIRISIRSPDRSKWHLVFFFCFCFFLNYNIYQSLNNLKFIFRVSFSNKIIDSQLGFIMRQMDYLKHSLNQVSVCRLNYDICMLVNKSSYWLRIFEK